MVVTKNVRLSAPLQFKKWIEKRRENIERVRETAGVKKPQLSMREAMRIIARTDGVNLPDYILKEVKKR